MFPEFEFFLVSNSWQKSGENTFCVYSTGNSFSSILANTESSRAQRKLVSSYEYSLSSNCIITSMFFDFLDMSFL